ncbi:MAG: ABC-type branched-chain amino acid transport system, periplasmic component [Solidesulfovibrio magneticus str. Maddingley MBC34]|uniref:ABC-type branched-chain amino acid transport system, periplasmic component n=1 Tax=Solidesulfovibrio magneticus str. Maddingley MBC34 TaxID=1206767 RepID=K6GR76_9BACT|nr:MAG: ABC-type branched-chain amino acid transport system, periplasmic component [Solidesulfovibrio magneticus str. Maddingley MBC34]
MSAKRVILTLVAMCLMAGTATAATLKIGSLSPLTGSYAADGNDIANGTRAAIAAIEKEGGIPGFDKIELFAEDSACDPRQAVAAANKLVNEKVVGVVGAYCSSATIPASETLAEADIPMLTPASTSEKVTERGLPYMFRVCGRDDDQSIAAMKFIKDVLKAKTIFIVDDKTTYSQGLADNVEKLANKEGLKVIAHDHVNQGDKDFSAVLTKIKDAKPDVLYMSLQNSASGALMLIQAKRAGVTAAIIGQDAVYHPQLMEIAKDAAEGMYLTFGYIDEETPSYKKFLAAYEKFGKPGAYSAYAYDAAYSLLSAIKAAKSTDPAKIKAELIKGDMQGASKKIKFQANGESGSNYIIRVVKDGKFANFWDPQTGKKY